ncbi:phospholipase [Tannerella forsythia]|uniref:phospholipase n=1 Tax=Tannerella forsythia TaxID=28112 RepID=UPI003C6FF772
MMIIGYILLSIVVLGLIAAGLGQWERYVRRRRYERGEIEHVDDDEPSADVAVSSECCGQHELCERESLLAVVSRAVEYYNDEELDGYRGTPSDAYSDNAVEEFREVLYTLREDEVSGWVRSLQLRGIFLPDAIKDETFLIVGERRK